MLNKEKIANSDFCKSISNVLSDNGVETPIIEINQNLSIEDKQKILEDKFTEILKILGLDLSNDSLSKTPERISKMFLKEIFWGLDKNNFPKCTTIENKMNYDELIVVKDITVNSFCEHHFLPFLGKCHIAYLPDKKILGLSKFNRIVEFFCKRPQVQERLTEQIFYSLSEILGTKNIAVIIEAKHTCVAVRGVEDIQSLTFTSKMGGIFKNNNTKKEFLNLIRR